MIGSHCDTARRVVNSLGGTKGTEGTKGTVNFQSKTGRLGNEAVNSQNEAVRLRNEAVNFRNEAVKRTSAPCPTEKRSMKKTKRSMTVKTNAADRFFKVSVEIALIPDPG